MSIKIKQQGFSLIEIALTILLISILLAGSLTLTGAFRDLDKREQVVEQLADISKAMNMYLAVNKHLPCPDIDGDGREDRHLTGHCNRDMGGLPYVDLAVARRDAWGNPFAYQVNTNADTATYSYITDICEPASVFAKTGSLTIPAGFEYCPASATYFCDGGCADACGVNCVIRDPRQPNTPPFFHFVTQPIGAGINFDQNDNKGSLRLVSADDQIIANSIVAMVISYGKNGYKFWNRDRNGDREIDSANCSIAAGLTPIEVENCNQDNQFQQALTGEELNFFTWMTLNEAKQIMIQTGGFSE